MGKYSQYRETTSERERQAKKHLPPVWRGVGFVLMVAIPVGSYYATLAILRQNMVKNWFPIPTELISPWLDPYLFVKLLMTLVIAILIFAIVLFLWTLFNLMFGPSRYGPQDAPPINPQGGVHRAR